MSLTILDSTPRIRSFEVYDFEWIPGTLKMRMCGRYNQKGYSYFMSVDDYLSNVLTFSNRGKWFFAHAGGLADVQFILEKLAPNPRFTIEASFLVPAQ